MTLLVSGRASPADGAASASLSTLVRINDTDPDRLVATERTRLEVACAGPTRRPGESAGIRVRAGRPSGAVKPPRVNPGPVERRRRFVPCGCHRGRSSSSVRSRSSARSVGSCSSAAASTVLTDSAADAEGHAAGSAPR